MFFIPLTEKACLGEQAFSACSSPASQPKGQDSKATAQGTNINLKKLEGRQHSITCTDYQKPLFSLRLLNHTPDFLMVFF